MSRKPTGKRRASGIVSLDNGSFVAKQRIRVDLRAELGGSPSVLEGFAGEGRIWRACWSGCRGATIDRDEAKVRAAARERPRVAVYRGDTEQALRGGWFGHVPWDVVDLDPYGSPWPFVRAWCIGERARAARTVLVLTDGYFRKRGMVFADRTLFPHLRGQRATIPEGLYLERVRERIAEWSEGAGLEPTSLRFVDDRNMRLWRLDVQARSDG